MGVALKEIITKKEIEIDHLTGKVVAVDSYNMLYQFLTTIRQRDGSLLTDSQGNVTSHLIGLFSRTMNIRNRGIRPIFVFDGKTPELKRKELDRRKEIKSDAHRRLEDAEKNKDIEQMKKYAARTSRLTPEMVQDSKELIQALGLPIVQAPCEGEAQASYITNRGDAYCVVSQDFDSLLFGAHRVVQNLSISEKRKLPGKFSYHTVKPCMIDLAENLNKLGIDQEQLVVLGILIGTDYNLGGIKGIGPKNAIKLVKENKDNYGAMFEKLKWSDHFDYSWKEVYHIIRDMPVEENYDVKFHEADKEKVIKILCDRHNFAIERVENALTKTKENRKPGQKSLGDF